MYTDWGTKWDRPAPRVLIILLTSILLMGALALWRCSGRSRPNVLWITVDSLRPDHLGCYGYERSRTRGIDALAGDGILFDACIAQAPYTHLSVPSMITGKYPRLAGVRAAGHDLPENQTTLAELLLQEGYFTVAIPMAWKEGITQGFQHIFPATRSSSQKTQWYLEAVDDSQEKPFFIWLYYWDPHVPYTPPEEFMHIYEPDYTGNGSESAGNPRRLFNEEQLRDRTGYFQGRVEVLNRVNEGRLGLTEAEHEHLVNLYDAEVAFVDAEIGRVLADLKDRGLWDNTLVILNADHGEGFGEHGRYYHGLSLYEDQIRVPLIIKPHRRRSGVGTVSGSVRNVDIVPTILDLCGIDPPGDLDGRSLRPYWQKAASPNLPSCLETSGYWKGAGSEFQLAAVRMNGYKLIGDVLTGQWQLYDLSQDPGEQSNLLAVRNSTPIKQREEALRQELFSTLGVKDLSELKLTPRDRQMDRGTTQQLKALGYID